MENENPFADYPADHVYVNLRSTEEDVEGVIEEKKIITEDLQDFFEPLVLKEKNTCDHIVEFNESLRGHSQLRDRITCTPLYPDSLYVCGSKKIFEYNRENKEIHVLYDLPDDNASGYNLLTAIKAYKKYLFIGDMQGIVRRLTLGSLQCDQVHVSGQGSHDMVNGFGFYEFDGKAYIVIGLNSWNDAIYTYEVESLKLVHSAPVPHPNRKTCVGGVSVSPSNRFMIAIGDKQEIYVYEIVPEGDKCTYKIRRTFGVSGNCHTAHWAPDESCFAVTSEAGYVYLFSFKVVSDTDLDVQFVASYQVKKSLMREDDYYYGGGIENVKFHPRSDVKLMAYAAANYSHVYVVDYSTLQIVQILVLPEEKGKINNGIEFSPDGKNLYAIYGNGAWSGDYIGQLLVAKRKGVDTLTELCLKHIKKHKDNWHPVELQYALPESLFEKLGIEVKNTYY